MQRILFVDRMHPADAEHVSKIWTEHDATGLPHEIGVSRRTLFTFQGLYVHLVEGRDDIDGDLLDRIYAARNDPLFVQTRDNLEDFVSPYSPTCGNLKDTRAEEFYRWQA